MKKFLSFMLSLMCVVILSVAASVYVIELKWDAEHNVSKTNRYQLLFGKIRHTTSVPKTGEPGIVISSPSEELACFKFDTTTGETWRYESDFYQDANTITTTKGLELVKEGFNIYNITQKDKKPSYIDIPLYPGPSEPGWWLSKAMITVADIRDDNIKVFAYGDIAESQAKIGNFSTAKSLAENLSGYQKSHAYQAIIEAQAERGDLAGARITMRKIGDDEDGQDKAYAAIAKGHAKAGNILAAKATAVSIVKSHIKDSVYESFVQTLVSMGDISGAERIARDVNDTASKVDAYCTIAEAQIKIGKINEAKETFEQAKAAFATFDNKGLDCLLTSANFLRTQVITGDLSGAKMTADILKRDYDNIARGQAETGDIAGAKVTAASIDDNRDKALAYTAIAENQVKRGEIDDAKETLKKVESFFMNIPGKDLYPRRYVCLNIAKIYAIMGDFSALQKWTDINIDPLILTNIYIGAAQGLIEKNNIKNH